MKTNVLHYRKLELELEEKEHKKLVEKETKKLQSNTSSMQTEQTNNRGKDVI